MTPVGPLVETVEDAPDVEAAAQALADAQASLTAAEAARAAAIRARDEAVEPDALRAALSRVRTTEDDVLVARRQVEHAQAAHRAAVATVRGEIVSHLHRENVAAGRDLLTALEAVASGPQARCLEIFAEAQRLLGVSQGAIPLMAWREFLGVDGTTILDSRLAAFRRLVERYEREQGVAE